MAQRQTRSLLHRVTLDWRGVSLQIRSLRERERKCRSTSDQLHGKAALSCWRSRAAYERRLVALKEQLQSTTRRRQSRLARFALHSWHSLICTLQPGLNSSQREMFLVC